MKEVDTNLTSISINRVEYVPKTQIKEQEINTDKYCIVRTLSAGVFAGNVVERDKQEVLMHNARRLWYWEGAASLSQLATEGVSKPETCKFPCEVPEITLLQTIEIIPCTKKAIRSIKGVKIWES